MTDSATLQLACQLITRPSVTPADAGCLDIVGQRLAPLGFTLEPMDHGPVRNLWGRRGSQAPLICLAGHVDVVPPGPLDLWSSDPFSPTCRGGNLQGRGAADMKSSIAAFVIAVERFLAAQPRPSGSLAFLLTSDEEGDAVDGTAKVVEALRTRGEPIDYCIVGEPTSSQVLGDMIKNGRRGSLGGKLRVRGIQGHVAYPHLARNPVHQAAPALAELASTVWDAGDEYFPPTSFQVSNIHAGAGVTNVIPGTLEVLFNLRFSPASSAAQLRARVESILARHALDYEIEWTLSGEPYLTPRGRLVSAASEAIRQVTGITPEISTSGGTSDGRFIAGICPEVIEFGPINATIHKVDERIAVADLDRLTDIYFAMLERLLGH